MPRDWFRVEAAAKGKGGGEILIYGSIGKSWWDEDAVGAKAFVKELDGLVKAGPGDIHIRINSPGGNVGDGMAIYNAIRSVKDRCYATIEGTAYSMASVIALAGRETRMHDTGQFMVHNPSVSAYGGEKEMESAIKALKTAKTVLVKAYTAKTAKTKAEIEEIMGDTTFMTADEAKESGFVDAIIEGDELQKVAACFDVFAWREHYEGRGPLPVNNEINAETAVTHSEDNDVGGDKAPVVGESQAGMPAPLNGGNAPKEKKVMVTIVEIEKACPKATEGFVLAQAKLCANDESRTLGDVKDAYIEEREKALEAANARATEAEKLVEDAKKKPAGTAPSATAPGVPPLTADSESDGGLGGDPVAAYHEAVAEHQKRGLDKAKAIRAVAVNSPEIHSAYLRAHNAEQGRPVGRYAV